MNLGCGTAKIKGCVNVDIEKSCAPDLVWNFKQGLPFPTGFVDQINFFHVIEHIEEKFHENLLKEFHRVLKPSGLLFVSYPEFVACAKNYINNAQGNKDFWKATIYGRQLWKADYHVSLMDSRDFYNLLDKVGFGNIIIGHESQHEPFNSVVHAQKTHRKFSYEDALRYFIWGEQPGE